MMFMSAYKIWIIIYITFDSGSIKREKYSGNSFKSIHYNPNKYGQIM